MLARMEGIEMEQMLPATKKNTPRHHSNSLIIKIKKDHKGILADIGNTILTIWPRYLEVALGHLGKYMPVEIHITISANEYNKYTHATTKLMDFKENGLHKHITYPGVYNKHRKPSNKALRIILDHAPGITPNIMEKTKHIVDLIKAADRTVNTRIIELAAAGVNLNHINEEQVRILQIWGINVTIISKISVENLSAEKGNISKDKHCLDDSRCGWHRNLTNSGRNTIITWKSMLSKHGYLRPSTTTATFIPHTFFSEQQWRVKTMIYSHHKRGNTEMNFHLALLCSCWS